MRRAAARRPPMRKRVFPIYRRRWTIDMAEYRKVLSEQPTPPLHDEGRSFAWDEIIGDEPPTDWRK